MDPEINELVHEENDFICPLCLNFMVKTVTTVCGHSFCETCIFEYLILFFECPQC